MFLSTTEQHVKKLQKFRFQTLDTTIAHALCREKHILETWKTLEEKM